MRSLLACAAGLMAGIVAGRAELPFTLDDPASQWKSVSIQRTLANHIALEQVLTRVGGPDRFIIYRSDEAPGAPDSLETFAQLLRSALAEKHDTEIPTKESTRLGFRGRDLQFAMVTDHGAFDCELFVFADHQIRWGVLYATAKGAPPSPSPVFDLLRKEPPPPPGVVELPPLRVAGAAVSDFPISFKVIGRAGTHLVQSIVVTEVPDAKVPTPTQIEVGDEIVAIDGRPSQEFGTGVGKDSELGRIFLNRHSGDEVKLALVSARTHQPYSVTLRINATRLRSPWGL